MRPETPKEGALLYEGAEARITAGSAFGRRAVVKVRRPKVYRIKEIEAAIVKARMRNEARLLRRARAAGVGAPEVLDADLEAQALTLTYLGPSTLRATFDALSPPKRRRAARAMGEAVGLLHKAGITHGDLTTSNMVEEGGRLYLIDFSLGAVSEKVEDRAVDLKAFKDSFAATHLEHAADFRFVLSAYKGALGAPAARVVAHITSIERRRRYA